MSRLRTPVRNRLRSPRQAPHQLSIAFDTAARRRQTPTHRATAQTHLAHLVLLAAGAVVREVDDDER